MKNSYFRGVFDCDCAAYGCAERAQAFGGFCPGHQRVLLEMADWLRGEHFPEIPRDRPVERACALGLSPTERSSFDVARDAWEQRAGRRV